MTSPNSPAPTRVVAGASRPEPALGTWVLTAIAALLVAAGVLSVLPQRSTVRAAPGGGAALHDRSRTREDLPRAPEPAPAAAPRAPAQSMNESSPRAPSSLDPAARDALAGSAVPAAAPDR